jgi:hypothetical protein
MNKKIPKPQRGIVYQRRVQPWEWGMGWIMWMRSEGTQHSSVAGG